MTFLVGIPISCLDNLQVLKCYVYKEYLLLKSSPPQGVICRPPGDVVGGSQGSACLSLNVLCPGASRGSGSVSGLVITKLQLNGCREVTAGLLAALVCPGGCAGDTAGLGWPLHRRQVRTGSEAGAAPATMVGPRAGLSRPSPLWGPG